MMYGDDGEGYVYDGDDGEGAVVVTLDGDDGQGSVYVTRGRLRSS